MHRLRIGRRTVSSARHCAEVWIGAVERCGGAWTFAVCGNASIESPAYASREAAEHARAAMFAALVPKAIAIETPSEE